jgi:subtilisin-like proprotein convertase family protein
MKNIKRIVLGLTALSGILFTWSFMFDRNTSAQNKRINSPNPGLTKGISENASERELLMIPAARSLHKALPYIDAGRVAAPVVPTLAEIEPNNSVAAAQVLTGTNIKIQGYIQPGTDNDYYAITAAAGDRLYTATQTSLSSGGSGLTGDGTIEVIATDGTTVLELDNDDGSFAATAPSVAGLVLPTAGTYYIRMRHSSASPASEIDPYFLYIRLQSAAPTAEVEPNNNGGTPNPIPASGHVSGVIDPATPTIDNDTWSIALNAGDTIFVSVDANPERDGTTFNPRLGIGLFDNFFVLADGSAAVSPNSEAFFMTVKDAGNYVIYVDTAVAGAGPTATYNMSVSVIPRETIRTCTTYTSTDVPQTIPLAAGIAVSTVNVPDARTIANLRVNLNITHTTLGELDVSLVSPDGNEVVLFDDPPAAAAGTTAPQIDVTLDDENGLTMALFGINKPIAWQPESLGRLEWFRNQNSLGTWTLNVRDDAGVGNGTLNSWGITVCEDPPVPACPVAPTSVFSANFDTTDDGFTHSGTADEWERGVPSGTGPITTCAGGSAGCWKTDLDDTYNNAPTGQRVDQELLSPPINLTAFPSNQQILLNWAMKYHVEGSNWENAFVEVREVGNPANTLRIWEWAGPTMTRTVGSPAVTINSAAGWGNWQADIRQFGGTTVQVAFHLDQDDSVALFGLAIDNVGVTQCNLATAANVSVGGRVLTAEGMPIGNATVRIMDDQGISRTALTNAFGFYRFDEVQAGQTYVLSASKKRFRFNPVFVNVGDEITGLDLFANPME